MTGIISRGNSYSNVDNGTTGLSDNPMFKINLRGLTTSNEQSPQKENKPNNSDITKKFKVGDVISGISTDKQEPHKGTIISIKKNENGEGSTILVLDIKTHKKVELEASSCEIESDNTPKIKGNLPKENYPLPFTTESHRYVLGFKEFLSQI